MTAGDPATPEPNNLEAELETVRRRFGHLGNVDGKLGQGAMGGVYGISKDGTSFALKVILPKTLSDDASVKRFHLEGKLLMELDHPNILKVFDVGTCGDWPYMISELVDGGAVDQLVEKGALGWDRALEICESVLDALAEVHKRKIYHRDIKPSNVLLTKAGVVKVADFGIAKAEGQDAKKTTTGIILGTPAYIAPEVLKGRPADAKSDLYSVGVLLFELIAGRLPWDHDDPSGFLVARLQMTEPPKLVTFVPNVPRTVDALVQTALIDNPVDRYPTAGTFLKALRITRERLVSTQGKQVLATARMTGAAPVLEMPDGGLVAVPKKSGPVASPEPAATLVEQGSAMATPGGMRATSNRLRRPPLPARPLPADEPSRMGPLAIGLAAVFGILTIGAIVRSRGPAKINQLVLSGPGTLVTLSEEEQQRVSLVLPSLMNDPTGKMAEPHLKSIAESSGDSGPRILYYLSTQTPLKDVKLMLARTRSPLAVNACVALLVDVAAGDEARDEAAQALLSITTDNPKPDSPGGDAVKLSAFLTGIRANEKREIVAAAIRTLGWYASPLTTPETITAMCAAPGKTGWVGGEMDPEVFLRKALTAIDTPAAREAVKNYAPARGSGSLDRLSGKSR